MTKITKPDILEHLKHTFAQMGVKDGARQDAFEKFLSQGWPNRRMENWRYTSLQKLAQTQYACFSAGKNISAPTNIIAPGNTIRIIVTPSQWQCLDALPDGITITALQDVIAPQGNHPLATLNGALYQNGITLIINGVIDTPIYLLHYITQECDNTALHKRYKIILQQNARAEIVEHYLSESALAYHHNIVTNIELQENSHLIYHKLQQESLLAHHTALTNIKQDKSSQFQGTHFSLGSQLARDDVQSELQEKSICHLHGAYLPRATQHIDHHLDISHDDSLSESEMQYKGILNDKAVAVFNGKVLVKPNIHKIAAIQKNHNLLLSKDCEVNSKPELEIYSDDIRCSHGATTGHIDPAALFYLRARGLSIEEAKLLIIHAFIQTEIDAVKNENVRKFIENIVISHLHEVCYAI